MRKPSLVVLAALLFAGSAFAEPTDFSGTLTLSIGTLPPIDFAGTGIADFTDPTNFNLPGGTFAGTEIVPITDPAVSGTIPSLRATLANGAGTFTSGGGPMPILGSSSVCLFVAGCGVKVVVPFDTTTAAVGVAGTIAVTGAVGVTLADLGPWTTGTVAASGPTAMGGTQMATAMGGVVGNTVTLVTPFRILTSLSVFPFLPGFAKMTLTFAPEPGSTALLAGALASLFALSRWRRKA